VINWLSCLNLLSERLVKVKETVRSLLDRLPENCTLDDVLYHLYVLQSVERGRADVAAGRTVSHEEVERELRKKWLLGAAG
jgi:predicted transcriptional regulator